MSLWKPFQKTIIDKTAEMLTRKLVIISEKYFVADEKVKSKEDLMIVVKEKFGNMGVGVAKDEIFAIETGDHFSPGHPEFG